MAGTATQAPEKAAPKDTAAPQGGTPQDGGAPASTTPAADGQGGGAGLTLADLPHLAVAAPGATPDGAEHYLTDDGGTAEAWLAPGEDGQDAGFIRSAASPDRAVRVDDVQSWAQIVDSMGLREADPNADPQAPAVAPDAAAADAKPSDANAPQGKAMWSNAKHPRDRHGRFISIGAHIDLGGGKGGQVTHVSAHEVTIKHADGKTEVVKGEALKRAAVTGAPGGGAHSSPGLPEPRVSNLTGGTGLAGAPKDASGRLIAKGDTVEEPGNARSQVTGATLTGRLKVRREDGTTDEIDPKTVKTVGSGGATLPPGDQTLPAPRVSKLTGGTGLPGSPKDASGRLLAEGDTVEEPTGVRSVVTGATLTGRLKVRRPDGSTDEIDPATVKTVGSQGVMLTKAAAAGQVVTPDDHEEQTGIMVALMVPEGDAADIMLTDLPTALPASELHLTLAYLGKTEEVDDEGAYYANVLEALRDVAAQHDTLNGVVSGVGRFSIPGDADAFYYSFDAPELPDLRHDLVEALEEAGIDVSRDHGFTPHITICYLKEGEESPIRRAESKVLAFENLTFCYGDQRLNIRLGGTDPEEADAEFHMEAGRPGQFDSTAPSAIPDAKAKPNPFAKGGKKGGPPIATGAWVSWGNQRGRVDLVVTNGKVPGVEEDITGSTDKPAARVVVYEQGAGGKWKATGKKVGVSASGLKRSFPLTGGGGKFGKKDIDAAAPEAVLVDLLTGYYEATLADGQVKEAALVDPAAVWTVYGRGIESWPGEHTEVANEAWALGRTKAFLAVASGREVPGYEADRDLLPDGHPLAVKAAPTLTVVEASAPEVKVAATVATGEHLDAETVRKTIESLRALGLA